MRRRSRRRRERREGKKRRMRRWREERRRKKMHRCTLTPTANHPKQLTSLFHGTALSVGDLERVDVLVDYVSPLLQRLQHSPGLCKIDHDHHQSVPNVVLIKDKGEQMTVPYDSIKYPDTHSSQEICGKVRG